MRTNRQLRVAVLLCVVTSASAGWAAPPVEPPPTTVIVLRHAEKEDPSSKPDPQIPLSACGLQRAKRLKEVLQDAGVTKIFVTQKVRTQQTAQPLAAHLRLQATPINSTDTKQLLTEIGKRENAGGVIVVVGHSETVGGIVTGLGVKPTEPVTAEHFDNLFIVTITKSGARLVRATYGESRRCPCQDKKR